MFLKKFFEKIFFLKNFLKKKFLKKNVKKQGRPSAFFSHFAFLHFIWINCKKMQKNAKMAFLSFFAFLKTCTAHTPRVFAVKGGSHPGKNPPIYTVLNAAFSCVKTLCRGSQCWLVHDPAERQIFFEKKNFLLLREFCPLKVLKKKF